MQICVNVTCMYTNFGGYGLSSFGDTFFIFILEILILLLEV